MRAYSTMSANTSGIRLRPHHLLCLQTFVGRGYSEEFVRYMSLVKKQLAADPRTPITLVSGADDLCAHCPNCTNGKCTSEKPDLFDRQVLKKLKEYKQYSDAGSLSGIPEDLQISKEILSICCPGCEWRELCAAALAD